MKLVCFLTSFDDHWYYINLSFQVISTPAAASGFSFNLIFRLQHSSDFKAQKKLKRSKRLREINFKFQFLFQGKQKSKI